MNDSIRKIGRRAFLRDGTLMLASGMLGGTRALGAFAAEKRLPALKIGLLTDVHYADKDPQINRYYRESITKLREGINQFNASKADFVVELGDLIDSSHSVQAEIGNLRKIRGELARFKGDRFFVLGNHCVSTLSKEEFLQNFGAGRKETFYSFDRGSFHFIVLDACFTSSGESYNRGNFKWTDTDIPEDQQEWLKEDLRKTNRPSVVFVHQRLDVGTHYAARSAPAIREILEKSGRVLAVFHGHSHQNDYREIGGIHYCVLRAMVEGSGEASSGYSLLNIYPDGSMDLTGFRQQVRRQFSSISAKPTPRTQSSAALE
jgi:predicted phosphodiesterase